MSNNILSMSRPARLIGSADSITLDRGTLRSLLDLTSDLVAARQQFPRDDLLTTISHLCCLVSDLIEEGRGR
jgi:hypothetical protein